MKFETAVASSVAGTLAASMTMAYVRHEEEMARRAGLKGTSLSRDKSGRPIEFTLNRAGDVNSPVVVLESGLGSPLEGWDWIVRGLAGKSHVLRYHRRGYGRTRSRLRPHEMIEQLVKENDLGGPIIFVSHSLGTLVTANVLEQSTALLEQTAKVIAIDGTDAMLLDEARNTPSRSRYYNQIVTQDILGAVTGINRWVQGPAERDVEYVPDVQRSFITTSFSVPTLMAARREYLHEPTSGQVFLANQDETPVLVLAAADNVEQQRDYAERLQADFTIVPGSSHRSVIGKPDCADAVLHHIRKAL